jgi:proteasome beta subunit
MDDSFNSKMLKTGTTILGIVCKDGVVMAGDRQVTGGETIVMQKNFKKVVPITDYLVMGFTGSVSDAVMLTKLIKAELKLKELKSKKRPTVKESANLIASMTYNNIRQYSAIPPIVGTLVGGFNENGTTEFYSIEPAGSAYKVEDYDANFGSGMPYVLGYLEREYNKDVDVKKGVNLAVEALKSSTQRDVGSGYGIDVFTITKEGIKQVIEQEIRPEYRDREKASKKS